MRGLFRLPPPHIPGTRFYSERIPEASLPLPAYSPTSNIHLFSREPPHQPLRSTRLPISLDLHSHLGWGGQKCCFYFLRERRKVTEEKQVLAWGLGPALLSASLGPFPALASGTEEPFAYLHPHPHRRQGPTYPKGLCPAATALEESTNCPVTVSVSGCTPPRWAPLWQGHLWILWRMVQEEPLAGTESRVRLGSSHGGTVRTLYDLVRVTMHGGCPARSGGTVQKGAPFLEVRGGPACPWRVLVAGLWQGSDSESGRGPEQE